MMNIEYIRAMQTQGALRCPRCGRLSMKDQLHTNALSRQADVYICDSCGTDEALRDATGDALPEDLWYIAPYTVAETVAARLTYAELARIFVGHEAARPEDHLLGAIVFSAETWGEHYSLACRTYVVSSECKAYRPSMGGFSIFGTSVDGSDRSVRLDAYMEGIGGRTGGWKIDYCYLISTPEATLRQKSVDPC